MPETAYLTSALVTGVLLLAVWTLVLRMEWRQYELGASGTAGTDARAGPDGGGRTDLAEADADESVGAWVLGFVALAALAGGGAVLLVSDPALAAAVGNWVALALVFGVVLGGFLLWGTYSSARFRGLPSAHAALVSAWLFGALFVAGIAAKLVLAG